MFGAWVAWTCARCWFPNNRTRATVGQSAKVGAIIFIAHVAGRAKETPCVFRVKIEKYTIIEGGDTKDVVSIVAVQRTISGKTCKFLLIS